MSDKIRMCAAAVVERRKRQCERERDCGIDKLIDNNGDAEIKREENRIQPFSESKSKECVNC